MSVIIDRIGEFAKYTHRSIRQIELQIGAANGTLSKAIGKDKDVYTKWISSFIIHFPEVSPAWLLTGKGEMLLSQNQLPIDKPTHPVDEPLEIYQSKLLEQHQEVINSLKQVIEALRGQLVEKENVVQLKNRIIQDLEEEVKRIKSQ
ncbi:hypothetical protein IFO69_00025 [Echinicola sp. CAU 1574]|uniref:Uncharacterized protein n=1 Tax=Echinicola arenosa TaxID=2774144 RepID=A0ABR9AFC0_9BACT|nr:hypothetical protein [Echinicola arenosa]MBD8487119.1 hypothetical protein [Echinicola arenosa]